MGDFKKVKVKVLVLGGLKHAINFNKVAKWKTSFFEITSIERIKSLPNSTTVGDWYYTDVQLEEIISTTDPEEIVFAVINHPLEDNFYGRRIGQNYYVLSLYETDEIVLGSDFKIEHFIIHTIYYVAALYYRFKGNIPKSDTQITHHDIRGCLFDFNSNKNDLTVSLGKVSICDDCKTGFNSVSVPDEFLDNIQKELKRIRKSNYYLIRDFIRRRPILALFIGGLLTMILNVISSFIYSYLTGK